MEDFQSQLTEALYALDRAITGKDLSTFQSKYGRIEDIASGQLVYLSDGGYTRIAIRLDEDDRVVLRLVAQGVTDRKPSWDQAVSEKRAVCNVAERWIRSFEPPDDYAASAVT